MWVSGRRPGLSGFGALCSVYSSCCVAEVRKKNNKNKDSVSVALTVLCVLDFSDIKIK